MQCLVATMVGGATIPLSGFAHSFEVFEDDNNPKPIYIPPGEGKKGRLL